MNYYAELGVCDTLNKNGWKNSSYVCYLSNGKCNAGGIMDKQGSGFKEGEKVTVAIDLNEGSIQWRVGL